MRMPSFYHKKLACARWNVVSHLSHLAIGLESLQAEAEIVALWVEKLLGRRGLARGVRGAENERVNISTRADLARVPTHVTDSPFIFNTAAELQQAVALGSEVNLLTLKA